MKMYNNIDVYHLEWCKHFKNKKIGSVGCISYCTFCSNYRVEDDCYGRSENISLVCNFNERKEKLKKINNAQKIKG